MAIPASEHSIQSTNETSNNQVIDWAKRQDPSTAAIYGDDRIREALNKPENKERREALLKKLGIKVLEETTQDNGSNETEIAEKRKNLKHEVVSTVDNFWNTAEHGSKNIRGEISEDADLPTSLRDIQSASSRTDDAQQEVSKIKNQNVQTEIREITSDIRSIRSEIDTQISDTRELLSEISKSPITTQIQTGISTWEQSGRSDVLMQIDEALKIDDPTKAIQTLDTIQKELERQLSTIQQTFSGLIREVSIRSGRILDKNRESRITLPTHRCINTLDSILYPVGRLAQNERLYTRSANDLLSGSISAMVNFNTHFENGSSRVRSDLVGIGSESENAIKRLRQLFTDLKSTIPQQIEITS